MMGFFYKNRYMFLFYKKRKWVLFIFVGPRWMFEKSPKICFYTYIHAPLHGLIGLLIFECQFMLHKYWGHIQIMHPTFENTASAPAEKTNVGRKSLKNMTTLLSFIEFTSQSFEKDWNKPSKPFTVDF